MSYKVLIAFSEMRRIYAKDTVQEFGEWPDDIKKDLIQKLIITGLIEENIVQPDVTEPPAIEHPQE